jgi:PKD repeat protein
MHRFATTLVALSLASVASAQFSLVTPNGYASTEGDSNNSIPWNRGTASSRIQYIIDSSHFTNQGITYPIVISQLRYRADAVATTVSWAGGSWPNIRIDMATCPLDYAAASTTFANNLGADLTTVVNGPVTVSPGTGNGVGIPGQWYITIPLTTPFQYNPVLGNDLTIDIYEDGTGWTGTSAYADHVGNLGASPVLGSRVYSIQPNALTAPTGNYGSNTGAVTEFTYAPASGLYSNLSANVTGGATPLAVNFTSTSYSSDPGGITSYAWDFDGDSVIDSTLANPTFVYNTCGVYTVSLTVTDATHAPSTFTRTNYINTDNVTPSFTYSMIAPGVVQFTDTSTPPPTSWAWDFNGDSIIDSTAQNPVWPIPMCSAATVSMTASRLCKGPFTTTRTFVVSPNQLTTTFVGGNGLSGVGAGNTFDVQVTNPSGITICAIEMAPYMALPLVGAPLGCTVFVTANAGGYLANHTNAAVWRQVATGTGTYAGGTISAPVAVPMALSQPIYLAPGTYGMAVHMTSGSGVAYNNVSAPFTYSGPDFNIVAGNAKTAPFVASSTPGRGWNGRIHYSTPISGGLAGYGFFGAGCAGTLGITHVLNANQPVIGGTVTLNLDNLEFGIAVMVLGLSNTLSGGAIPLPLDLGILGAPGCPLRVSLDATDTVVGTGTTATWSFAIPSNPLLLGFQLYNQAAALSSSNAFNFVTSDAYAWCVGN